MQLFTPSWLAKFRLSAALDAGRPSPASPQAATVRSEELQRFEQSAVALGRELSQTVPECDTPAFLHASIMRAVQAAGTGAAPRSRLLFPRWAVASAAVGLAVLALWATLRRPPALLDTHAQSLATVSTTLDLGHAAPDAIPAALLAPLSEELERVHRDLTNTAQFLYANLP